MPLSCLLLITKVLLTHGVASPNNGADATTAYDPVVKRWARGRAGMGYHEASGSVPVGTCGCRHCFGLMKMKCLRYVNAHIDTETNGHGGKRMFTR